MDATKAWTVTSLVLLAVALIIFIAGGAVGGWSGLGLAVVGMVATGLAAIAAAVALLVAPGRTTSAARIGGGPDGLGTALFVTVVMGLIMVGVALFADLPAAWRIGAGAVAALDAVGVAVGTRRMATSA